MGADDGTAIVEYGGIDTVEGTSGLSVDEAADFGLVAFDVTAGIVLPVHAKTQGRLIPYSLPLSFHTLQELC